jgi:hypothetical protein
MSSLVPKIMNSLSTAPATTSSSAPSGLPSLRQGFQPVHHGDHELANDYDEEDEQQSSSDGSPRPDSSGPRKEGGSGRISLNNLKDQQQEVLEWLKDNYEPDDEISLARDAIFGHYTEHCQDRNTERMGTASFGKIIRLVFPAVKTRRLGIRGQSKYHYQGIRIKGSSPLAVRETQQRSLPQSKRCSHFVLSFFLSSSSFSFSKNTDILFIFVITGLNLKRSPPLEIAQLLFQAVPLRFLHHPSQLHSTFQ